MVRDNGGEGDLSGQDRCCLITYLGVFCALGCSWFTWNVCVDAFPPLICETAFSAVSSAAAAAAAVCMWRKVWQRKGHTLCGERTIKG